MTKKEYLDKLTKELGTMSYNDVREIIGDIEAHFEESKLAGKTEEETCEQLGNPSALAAEYKDGMTLPVILQKKVQKQAPQPKAPEPTAGTVMFVILMTIFIALPAWITLFGIMLIAVLTELAFVGLALFLLCTCWFYGTFLASGLLAGLTLLFLSVFGYAVCYFAIKYFALGTKWYIKSMTNVWHNGL